MNLESKTHNITIQQIQQSIIIYSCNTFQKNFILDYVALWYCGRRFFPNRHVLFGLSVVWKTFTNNILNIDLNTKYELQTPEYIDQYLM